MKQMSRIEELNALLPKEWLENHKDDISEYILKGFKHEKFILHELILKFGKRNVIFVSTNRQNGKIIPVKNFEDPTDVYVKYYYMVFENYEPCKLNQHPILEIYIEDEYIRNKVEHLFIANIHFNKNWE